MAEAYLLNRLAPDVAVSFEKHYIECEACAEVLGEAGEFIAGMKEAAFRLGPGRRLARLPNSGLYIVEK
jgi:hypothetical protein